jgi:hypothetical protein
MQRNSLGISERCLHASFLDAPDFIYAADPRARRIAHEVAMLAAGYGAVNYDDRGFTWVHVPQFRLPRGWNARQSGILLEVPPQYPSIPPDGFYLLKGLRDAQGLEPTHYFQAGSSLNRYADRGWAWYCMHARGGWHATADIVSGHNLLKYLELIRAILSDPPKR